MLTRKQWELLRKVEKTLGVHFTGSTKAEAGKFLDTWLPKLQEAELVEMQNFMAHMYSTGQWKVGDNYGHTVSSA